MVTIQADYPQPTLFESAVVIGDLYPSPLAIPTPAVYPAASDISPAPSENVLQLPVLGSGWVLLPPLATDQPPVRAYVCPWLEFAGDLPIYRYRVINRYPHDPNAYTQGLIYREGVLYESTGLRGRSSIRIVDLESGEVLSRRDLPEPFFAEGIALLQGKIFQLTWQEQTAFVYNPETLAEQGQYYYQTEGWGLADNGELLIMSDGSEHLSFRDPVTFDLLRSVLVASEFGVVQRLNELEYVRGEIWANVYQTSCIARVNPTDGKVLGWIDINGLLTSEEMATAEVPNGVAFDEETGRVLITGKFWPWLFEVEIVLATD